MLPAVGTLVSIQTGFGRFGRLGYRAFHETPLHGPVVMPRG